MIEATTLTTVAIVLGIYASAVSTLVALVTLYGEVFARIDVLAREGYLVPVAGRDRPLLVFGDGALEAIGAAAAQRYEIVSIAARNRGRRAAQIKLVSKAGSERGFYILDELLPAVPFVIEPGHTVELTIGDLPAAGYHHGDLGPMKRFFVVDGAGRIHPLRERWRQAPGRSWRRFNRWRRGR